jgi:hypothetical protein
MPITALNLPLNEPLTHCTSAPSLRFVWQRCCEFWLGARREEGEYPLWSLTDEQQSPRRKSAQPSGWGDTGVSPRCWLVK